MNTTKSVPTDSPQKITVESQLLYALWQQGRAYAGFAAQFEVKTLLVGNGGKVKATLRTAKGKKLGKVEGVIVCNRWRGTIVIPEKVQPGDFVYLDVELPKHGLSIDSNEIPVRPPIEVSSMRWSKVVIHREEEVMMTCTFTNGVEEGDEVTVNVYEYDNDGNHDIVVKIPTLIKNNKVELNWKFIYQDDTDDIPTDEKLKKYGKKYNPPEYFFVVMVDTIPVGSKQESGILEFKDYVEIDLGIDSGFAVADKTVTVTFADGTTKDEKLDDKGYVKISDTPPGPYKVELKAADSATVVKSKGGAGAGAGSGGGASGSVGGTGGAGGSQTGAGSNDTGVKSGGSSANDEEEKKNEPKWIAIAKKEIGQKEIAGAKNNPRIIEYHSTTSLKATNDEVAWCSAFVNWVMKESGYTGTGDARASSWKTWGKGIEKACYGCIAICDYGHVGFIVGKRTYPPNREGLLMLGGNQGKTNEGSVRVSWMNLKNLIAFRIPEGFTTPNYTLHDTDGEANELSFENTR